MGLSTNVLREREGMQQQRRSPKGKNTMEKNKARQKKAGSGTISSTSTY